MFDKLVDKLNSLCKTFPNADVLAAIIKNKGSDRDSMGNDELLTPPFFNFKKCIIEKTLYCIPMFIEKKRLFDCSFSTTTYRNIK